MKRIKVALPIVLAIIVLSVPFWYFHQPKPIPTFEIVEFSEYFAQYSGIKYYYIVFKIKNNGTGDATVIHGTIKIGLYEEAWHIPLDYVLKPGEISPQIHTQDLPLESKPKDPEVIIVVKCYEGITQQFKEYLLP